MTFATVNIDVDVDLSDVCTEDLLEGLESRKVPFEQDTSGLESIEHLALCGLIKEARQEALLLISKKIGRSLQ